MTSVPNQVMPSPNRFVSSPVLRRALEELDRVQLGDHSSIVTLLQNISTKLYSTIREVVPNFPTQCRER